MCQYSSGDGFANDWHLVHLGARASGGAGLVIMEATAVEARGRISDQDNGIWLDAHVEFLSRIANFIHSQGAVAGIQIAHAGRKASRSRPWSESGVGGDANLPDEKGGWEVLGPSPVPFSERYRVPKEMTLADILEVQTSFEKATLRARKAGFKWLEIHGAHGYLIHSFLSPLSNQRLDKYGGSFENRTRFLREVTQKVARAWDPNLPLSVRLSCSDWMEGGWTDDDSVELSKILKTDYRVDLIDCSSGGNVPKAQIPVGPGYQVRFSESIRSRAGVPTAAVGMITDANQAQNIVETGKADLVFLAREMLRNPNWPIHSARLLGRPLPLPPQYLRAYS
jgi:2,4-dienoyl-CoA reductase-like NADH-dependent reductase (Old Yellow Enzyme family)